MTDSTNSQTFDTEESICVVNVHRDGQSDVVQENNSLEILFDDVETRCCTWTIILRPVLAAVQFAFSVVSFLVLFLPLVFVLFTKVLLVIFKVKSSIPPEPSKRKDGIPRIFFDGAGWGFAFEVGVCKYIHEKFDVAQTCEVFAISAGNVSASVSCLTRILPCFSVLTTLASGSLWFALIYGSHFSVFATGCILSDCCWRNCYHRISIRRSQVDITLLSAPGRSSPCALSASSRAMTNSSTQ
eukprot:766248-Hanusia_phi.AAC.7